MPCCRTGKGGVRRRHIDGILSGFRELGGPSTKNTKVVAPIPLLQLKLAYYLSDLSKPDQGNLTVIPKSHVAPDEPPRESLTANASSEGRAVQLCGPPGTCVMFHNATYHTAGPMRKVDGRRSLLYYGYEHPCESSHGCNHSAAHGGLCGVPHTLDGGCWSFGSLGTHTHTHAHTHTHPGMLACPEQTRYPKEWLSKLTDERKSFFHAASFAHWPQGRYV